jgi:hypothetical protein
MAHAEDLSLEAIGARLRALPLRRGFLPSLSRFAKKGDSLQTFKSRIQQTFDLNNEQLLLLFSPRTDENGNPLPPRYNERGIPFDADEQWMNSFAAAGIDTANITFVTTPTVDDD